MYFRGLLLLSLLKQLPNFGDLKITQFYFHSIWENHFWALLNFHEKGVKWNSYWIQNKIISYAKLNVSSLIATLWPHVINNTYEFQSESTLSSMPECQWLLAGIRHHIWCLSDSNVIRPHNHLVCKRTLNHLKNSQFG